jgi:hypothetical protein
MNDRYFNEDEEASEMELRSTGYTLMVASVVVVGVISFLTIALVM